eukprot:12892982-Alexandrium_andersonii.AAC.1
MSVVATACSSSGGPQLPATSPPRVTESALGALEPGALFSPALLGPPPPSCRLATRLANASCGATRRGR